MVAKSKLARPKLSTTKMTTSEKLVIGRYIKRNNMSIKSIQNKYGLCQSTAQRWRIAALDMDKDEQFVKFICE
jgi:hypothetical protein